MAERIEVGIVNDVQVVKAGKEGPNIIFLHPAGQPPVGMREHILQLAEAGQVVAPNIFDLIGSLRRRKVKNPSFADIVNEFTRLDLLDKNQRTGLVGASFGGQFAWEYATQYRSEVDFITMGSPTGWPLHRALTGWVAELIREYVWKKYTLVPKALRKRDPGPGLFIRQFTKNPAAVWHGLWLARNADSREQMADIEQPVDLLWGKRDDYVPLWSGQEMAKLIPNSNLKIVSNLGHEWINYEKEELTGPAKERARAN